MFKVKVDVLLARSNIRQAIHVFEYTIEIKYDFKILRRKVFTKFHAALVGLITVRYDGMQRIKISLGTRLYTTYLRGTDRESSSRRNTA